MYVFITITKSIPVSGKLVLLLPKFKIIWLSNLLILSVPDEGYSSFSGLSILDCPFGFLWIVHSWLSLQFSLTFICPVSCVSNVASFFELSILDCPFGFLWIVPSVFSDVYLSCVLCVQCCQFLWIVHSWLSLRFSVTCIYGC